MIKHLYFFDDLTYHIERICKQKGMDNNKIGEIKRNEWKFLNEAFSKLDMASQDYVLVNWQHVSEELGDRLFRKQKKYDLIVSQGCNGDYALHSFSEMYKEKYGISIADELRNVRVAHFLNNADDPFYSDFTIGVIRGGELLQQCKEIVDECINKDGKLKIAVFDDCIQTGKGTKAVVDDIEQLLESANKDYELDVLGFIGCEDTMMKFYNKGHYIETGAMLRGKTYPETWDNDIYFLKDLLLSNSIRFSNGTSVAYCDIDWYLKIFPLTEDLKDNSYIRMREYLRKCNLLDDLESL